MAGFADSFAQTFVPAYGHSQDRYAAQQNADREFGLRKEYHDAHMAQMAAQEKDRQGVRDAFTNYADVSTRTGVMPEQQAQVQQTYGMTPEQQAAVPGGAAGLKAKLTSYDTPDSYDLQKVDPTQAPGFKASGLKVGPTQRELLAAQTRIAMAEKNGAALPSLERQRRELDVTDAFTADRDRMTSDAKYATSRHAELAKHVNTNIDRVTYTPPAPGSDGYGYGTLAVVSPDGKNSDVQRLTQSDQHQLLLADHMMNNGMVDQAMAIIGKVNAGAAEAVSRSNSMQTGLYKANNDLNHQRMTDATNKAFRDAQLAATQDSAAARQDAATYRDTVRGDALEERKQIAAANDKRAREDTMWRRVDARAKAMIGQPMDGLAKGEERVHTQETAQAAAYELVRKQMAQEAAQGGEQPNADGSPAQPTSLGASLRARMMPAGADASGAKPQQTPARGLGPTQRGGASFTRQQLDASRGASAGPAAPFEQLLSMENQGNDPKLAAFARALHGQESGGGADTRTSNRGARGPMQIVGSTFSGVADPDWRINNPDHSTRAGIRYAKEALTAANGDPKLAAAYYYGGPNGLRAARQGRGIRDPYNPSYPDTLQYADQVAARMASAQQTRSN